MTKILKSVEKKIEVKVLKGHDPKKFFVDRKGLFIGYGFESNIRDKAKPTKAEAIFSLASSELTKNAYDKDIEVELPKDHLFSETDVCAIIAGLIEKQPNGEEGTLLNTGYANLFYTKSLVVGVGWYGGGWHVRTWVREHDWSAGDRVFSPATGI